MPTDLEYRKFHGLGLANNFCLKWLGVSGLPADLQSLTEDPQLLREVVQIVRGEHSEFQYQIDTSSKALRLGKYRHLDSHNPVGMLIWDESRIKLLEAEKELGREALRKGVGVENWCPEGAADASILEFLLKRPGRIPKTWDKSRRFLFPGTRYRYSSEPPYGDDFAIHCLQFEQTMTGNRWTFENVKLYDEVRPSDMAVTVV